MKEMKVRELIPPMYPPDSFTIEEARQAWREVEAEAEAEARRKAERKRSRAAPKKAARDVGEDR